MMYTIQKIEQQVLGAVKAAMGKQYTPTVDELTLPPKSEWGEFAYPCFQFAKARGIKPAEAAAELAPKIEPKDFISKVEARGPFVNFHINANELASSVLKEVQVLGEQYGHWNVGAKKKIMVEYAQPNTHKAVHVGHLRNIVLGETIARLLETLGFEVIRASYHGDTGMHVATTLWGLHKFHQNEEPPISGRGAWLGAVYAETVAYLEKHPDDEKQVRSINQKLEAGDRGLRQLWKETRRWSIGEFREIFDELEVQLDATYWESDMDREGKKIVADLLRKGIAKQSEGAIIVSLEQYGLDVFVVLKSDGTTLYSTRDLALAVRKLKEWKPDRLLVVVDARQSLYFKQLAKTLELWGFKKPIVHVPYEFVTLKGGMISSRKGTVVTYEEMRDAVIAQALQETKKRHGDWAETKIKKTAREIAFAAIKYTMLAHDTDRTLTFDIKAATSFDGATGPYLQYTGARIASILRKVGGKPPLTLPLRAGGETLEVVEKQLLLALARYPKVVLEAAESYRPSLLAAHLFDLAKTFSEFYEQLPVLKAPPATRLFRLDLIRAVSTVLESGARLLGFSIPKEM